MRERWLVLVILMGMTKGFVIPSRKSQLRVESLQEQKKYGRGAEIFPPTNDDVPIRLEDSFPNGILPPMTNDESTTTTTKTTVVESFGKKRRILAKVLRGAAGMEQRQQQKEEETNTTTAKIPISKSPMIVAIACCIMGLIRPIDVALVTLLSTYFISLTILSSSLDFNTGMPSVPSLPKQGHVPSMIRNPLGYTFTHSKSYKLWCQLGTILGFLSPIIFIGLSYQQTQIIKPCARPLFFLSCQIITETLSQRSLVPLPIRILIPVLYNAVRLGSLWNWTVSSMKGGILIGKVLSTLNMMYWTINLFGFLIPNATMKYMRAHFFCIEATEVQTTRNDQIGLL